MGDGATRRGFLVRGFAGIATLALAGCDSISQQPWLDPLLRSAEALTKRVQRLFAGDHALAQEFTKADIAPMFRANGTLDPGTQEYREHAQKNFADWRITVGGLVEHPLSLSMDQLRKLPARTQITRHDCVEGWSCIGEWTGAFGPRLLGLTGSPAQIKQAAEAFAVYYKKGETTPGGYLMDHSRIAFLMDPDGKPIAMLPIDKDPAAVAAELAKWVK